LTISIIVAIASISVTCLITVFEPQLTEWGALLAVRRARSVRPETDVVLAKRRYAAPKP
jgi:hypothetical protein